VGASALRWSIVGFVVVNGLAVMGFALTRDRGLVNRWTGRVLAANLVLAGTGIGIPLLTSITRLAVAAVMPGAAQALPTIEGSDRAVLRRPVELTKD
jgi:hypothetical protein